MIGIKFCSAKTLLATLMAIACMLSTVACAQLTFKAEAITGKVVDAETGKPLAGVIIVAQWTVEESLVGRGNDLLNVLETVTDNEGNYGFPAWGPKLLPSFPLSPHEIFGSGKDPLLVYFKNGYWPASEQNELSDPEQIASRIPPLGSFQANGKTIKLRKWDGKDEKDYYSDVESLASNVSHYGISRDWKMYPRLTLAIEQIRHQLRARGNLPWNFPIPRIPGFFIDKLSKEDQEFLKRYKE